MSMRSAKQAFGHGCGAIAVAISVLIPHLALGEPNSSSALAPAAIASRVSPPDDSTVIGAVGVIEITAPSAPAICELKDMQLEKTREQLHDAHAAAEAARARLVREHLRFTQGPIALLQAALDEEQLESERAQLRTVQREYAQTEDQLAAARCDAGAQQPATTPDPGVAIDVRMEFPPRYLLSLERTLRAGTNAIAAYGHSSGAAISGQLISVESAFVAGEPIVIARARLRDPLHRLRNGELVGVAVQLRSGLAPCPRRCAGPTS